MKQSGQPLDPVALMSAVRAQVSQETGDASGFIGDAPPEMSLDQIIARVAQAAGVAKPLQARLASETRSQVPMQRWATAQPRVQRKPSYVLAELLDVSDEEFIESAYSAIFKRRPDPVGRDYFLDQLRSGRMSKVEILGVMRFSDEGRRLGVHIDGLLVPFRLQQWSRKRVLGPILRWSHALLRLGRLQQKQLQLENYHAYETSRLGHFVNQFVEPFQDLKALRTDVEMLARRMAKLESDHVGRIEYDELQVRIEARVRDLKAQAEALALAIEMQSRDLETQVGAIKVQTVELEVHEAALQQLGAQSDEARTRAAMLEHQISEARTRTTMLEHQVSETRTRTTMLEQQTKADAESRLEEAAKAEAESKQLELLYVAFEDAFRGSRESVMIKAEPYVAWMEECGAGGAEAPILDIGCGRGEWLELVREKGWRGRGIDLNREFVDQCQRIGLDVLQGDAIEVLRGLPDGRIGAITSMHLVEHLPFADMVALIDECLRVLRPGGALVLETPNPENLMVGAHWFYLDPTHRNPIPPTSLRWLVEQRGFAHARIERVSYGRPLQVPPPVTAEVAGSPAINYLLDQVSIAVDYAVVARKAE